MAKRAKKGIEVPELVLGERYRIRVMGVSIVAKCMSKPVGPGSKMKIGFVVPGAGMRDELLCVKASDVVCRVPDQPQPGAAHIHDATITRESMKDVPGLVASEPKNLAPQPGQWWHAMRIPGSTPGMVYVLNTVGDEYVCWKMEGDSVALLNRVDLAPLGLTTTTAYQHPSDKQWARVHELERVIGPRNGWETSPAAPKVRALLATMTVYIPGVLKPSDPGAAQRSLEARWCEFEEAVKKAGGRPDTVQVDWAP